MSASVTEEPIEEPTWTEEQLAALTYNELRRVAMRLSIKAKGTKIIITNKILEFQQSKLADSALLPGSSPELSPPGPSSKPPSGPSPEPPGGPQPAQRALSVFEDPGQVITAPRKAGSNPSQDSVSSRSNHRSLGSNTSPRKDKGKGKETGAAGIEQLKGSSGESPSFVTSVAVQQATTTTRTQLKSRKKRRSGLDKKPKNRPHAAESTPIQSQEPNQTNDSQESQHQVQQIILVSDNSGASLNQSNSNRTTSSNPSWLVASFESRLRKLESSSSVESVRDQVIDLHKEVETVKTQLSEVQTCNAELREVNARIVQDNTQLRTENAEVRKENLDLKIRLDTLWYRVEELMKGKALAPDSESSSRDLGEPAPLLGSPPSIDEATTPKPDTTPRAASRHLEVTSTSEHAPLSLPIFSPLPPPNGAPGPVEMRPTSRPSSQTPSGSRQSRPSPVPSSPRPLGTSRKRKRGGLDKSEFTGPGPDLGGEPVRGGFTTPPPSMNLPSTPVLISRPDYPFNRGSPSPQQRQPPRTPPGRNLGSIRHRVPSPARRPGTDSSSAQPIMALDGDDIPGAPARVAAIPVRGDDVRRTPEPASGKVWSNHTVAPSTLASAAGGIFDPPSSSTPARPGTSSLLIRTSATTRIARVSRPYNRPTFISPPLPLPPAISASNPSAEGHDSGGSQTSSGSSSSGAEGANQAPAPAPVAEPATPGSTTSRLRRMPHGEPVQSPDALDPFRLTGAHQSVGTRVGRTTTPPETPDRRVRQVAPETPMASSTRYGTEISPSMRHLY